MIVDGVEVRRVNQDAFTGPEVWAVVTRTQRSMQALAVVGGFLNEIGFSKLISCMHWTAHVKLISSELPLTVLNRNVNR